MEILYEDNHIIIIAKRAGEIVQGDKTGDTPLPDLLKAYIKERDHKPGNVFLGVVHRLDRPVSGIVLFAKTSKALSRMNDLFRTAQVRKVYHAIVENAPAQPQATLVHYLRKNEKQNKSYPTTANAPDAKRAELSYRTIAQSDRYTLLEVELKTGRHHQIRCQLSANGTTIRGDLKYGAHRPLPQGAISLHARKIEFVHPVSRQPICIEAPYPSDDALWRYFESIDS